MNRTLFSTTLCVGLLVVLAACGDDGVTDPATYQLTFQGDASFQGPHGSHSISVRLVRTSDGALVGPNYSGTVSASADPAFALP